MLLVFPLVNLVLHVGLTPMLKRFLFAKQLSLAAIGVMCSLPCVEYGPNHCLQPLDIPVANGHVNVREPLRSVSGCTPRVHGCIAGQTDFLFLMLYVPFDMK